MKFIMNISGDKELIAAMNSLTSKEQETVLRRATNRSMRPVVQEVRRTAPVRSGQYRKSVGATTKWYRHGEPGKGVAITVVGPRKGFKDEAGNNPTQYAHLIEEGVQPHTITSEKGMNIGGVVVKTVDHPGFAGLKILTNAWKSKVAAVEQRFTEQMMHQITQAIKRRAKQ